MEGGEDAREEEGEGEARGVFLFACVAQKAGRHALARTAWAKYLAVRYFRGAVAGYTIDTTNCCFRLSRSLLEYILLPNL